MRLIFPLALVFLFFGAACVEAIAKNDAKAFFYLLSGLLNLTILFM